MDCLATLILKNVTCVTPKLEYDLPKGEQRLTSNEMGFAVTPYKYTNKVKMKREITDFRSHPPITYTICIMTRN